MWFEAEKACGFSATAIQGSRASQSAVCESTNSCLDCCTQLDLLLVGTLQPKAHSSEGHHEKKLRQKNPRLYLEHTASVETEQLPGRDVKDICLLLEFVTFPIIISSHEHNAWM